MYVVCVCVALCVINLGIVESLRLQIYNYIYSISLCLRLFMCSRYVKSSILCERLSPLTSSSDRFRDLLIVEICMYVVSSSNNNT